LCGYTVSLHETINLTNVPNSSESFLSEPKKMRDDSSPPNPPPSNFSPLMTSSHVGRGLIHNGPLADYYWIFGGPSLANLLGYKTGYLGWISWAQI